MAALNYPSAPVNSRLACRHSNASGRAGRRHRVAVISMAWRPGEIARCGLTQRGGWDAGADGR